LRIDVVKDRTDHRYGGDGGLGRAGNRSYGRCADPSVGPPARPACGAELSRHVRPRGRRLAGQAGMGGGIRHRDTLGCPITNRWNAMSSSRPAAFFPPAHGAAAATSTFDGHYRPRPCRGRSHDGHARRIVQTLAACRSPRYRPTAAHLDRPTAAHLGRPDGGHSPTPRRYDGGTPRGYTRASGSS
jgi:hypothetical protein